MYQLHNLLGGRLCFTVLVVPAIRFLRLIKWEPRVILGVFSKPVLHVSYYWLRLCGSHLFSVFWEFYLYVFDVPLSRCMHRFMLESIRVVDACIIVLSSVCHGYFFISRSKNHRGKLLARHELLLMELFPPVARCWLFCLIGRQNHALYSNVWNFTFSHFFCVSIIVAGGGGDGGRWCWCHCCCFCCYKLDVWISSRFHDKVLFYGRSLIGRKPCREINLVLLPSFPRRHLANEW